MQLNENYCHRIKIPFIKKEHVRTFELKEAKNITHFLLLTFSIISTFSISTSPLAFSV